MEEIAKVAWINRTGAYELIKKECFPVIRVGSLLRNDINPVLGEINVQDVDARVVDKFIATLQKTKAVDCSGRRAKTEIVTPCTIEKICKLMRCAFGQAIRWGMVGRNPFIGATLPKREQRKRAIWGAETIRRALGACEDNRL